MFSSPPTTHQGPGTENLAATIFLVGTRKQIQVMMDLGIPVRCRPGVARCCCRVVDRRHPRQWGRNRSRG
jgi:hypothetical protein